MDATPPVGRILETSLYVADLDRSEAFYRRVFGFSTMLRDHRMASMAVPGRQALLLFQRGGATEPSRTPFGAIPPHDGWGAQHLCFSIAQGALGAWQPHLAAAEVALESRIDWPQGAASLYFRDPDGHSLEVGTPGLWANDPIHS